MTPPLPDDDDLRPDMRAFAQRLAAGYAAQPALAGLDYPAARRVVEAVRAPFTAGGPVMAGVEEHWMDVPVHGRLRLRVYRPVAEGGAPGAALPALVYLHGGGWVFFSLDTHDRLMREYAAGAQRVVVGVDYAQAPEHRFPVAIDQAAAAVRWVRAHAPMLGVDPARVAVGGDSVGGNMSVACALLLREAGEPVPEALLLNYGVYGEDDGSESWRRYDGPRYVLERAEMAGFWQLYLRNERDRASPLAMPLKGELHGLPRSCLVVPECDVLRDSSLALARKLDAAGVPVTLQRVPGAPHSFLEAMSFAPTAQQAIADSCAWLRQVG